MSAHGVDAAKVAELKAREDARFTETHPRCIETWHRAERVMPNGVPMSWLRTSYDHPPPFTRTVFRSLLTFLPRR